MALRLFSRNLHKPVFFFKLTIYIYFEFITIGSQPVQAASGVARASTGRVAM